VLSGEITTACAAALLLVVIVPVFETQVCVLVVLTHSTFCPVVQPKSTIKKPVNK
jgi:hypothetical protein